MLYYTNFIHLLYLSLRYSFCILYRFVVCTTQGSRSSGHSGHIIFFQDLASKLVSYGEYAISLAVSMITVRRFLREKRIMLVDR